MKNEMADRTANRMSFLLFVAGCIAYTGAVSAATVVSAATAEHRFPISIADVQAKVETRFERIDTDHSGSVDLAEFEAAKLPEHAMRKRGGGQRKHAHAPGHEGMRTAMEEELFAIMDSDDSGSLSQQEYQSGDKRAVRQLARKRAAFKHMDIDQDNLLTVEEFARQLTRLRAADADADGMVSKDEMRAQRQQFRHSAGAG